MVFSNYLTENIMKLIVCLTLPIFSSLSAQADSLQKQLDTRAEEFAAKTPGAMRKQMTDGVQAVREAGVVAHAKQVGDTAPDFTLGNAKGEKVKLSNLLEKGPVVLTWYRGGWCPYCNLTLMALEKELPEIKAAGATLVALTPELPDKILTTTEKNSLAFEVLSDVNHLVAKEYGIVFKLTPEVRDLYKQRFDLTAYNGKEAGDDSLPLAATYIIGKDRKILWGFLDADYRKRAEPSEIVNFLKKQ